MLTTTLNNIRAHSPCTEGWTKLLAGLNKTQADDEPLPYAHILEINGLADTLWCMRAEPQHRRVWAEFALWCACEVKHIMKDDRSLHALETVRRYLDGHANSSEVQAARKAAATATAAAYAATATATAADAAAYAAAYAAAATATAAAYAAYAAAAYAAYAATATAADAADAAAAAAANAANAADAADADAYAAAAARERQAVTFLELITQGAPTNI